MHFEQLDDDYRDDHIAQALYAREMEWFHYEVDRLNFEHMLGDGALLAPVRQDLEQRLTEISVQQGMVERVAGALRAQIRSPEAHAAAVERARLKRE